MSVTFNIGCQQCHTSVWIGQGDYIYTGEEETMAALQKFLFNHRGHDLIFDQDSVFDGWSNYHADNYLKFNSRKTTRVLGMMKKEEVPLPGKKHSGVFWLRNKENHLHRCDCDSEFFLPTESPTIFLCTCGVQYEVETEA